MKHLTIISGDPSSDTYAYDIVHHLLQQDASWQIHGIGGPRLRAIAQDVMPYDSLCVVGLVEVLRHIRPILKLRSRLLKQLQSLPAHIVLLIDCPGFNMSLLRAIHKKHHIIYAIPPQVWAWHESRVHALKRYCQELWVLYPFEKDFYTSHNQDVYTLRHPLLAKPHLALRPLYEGKNTTIALLPGSRENEKKLLMPYLLSLAQRMPDIDWVWVESYPGFLSAYYAQLPGRIVQGLQQLPSVHAAVAASGTVTLELGLMGIPMLIIYKVSPITAWVAQRLVRIPYIGLPNILYQRIICPELVQNNLTISALEKELDTLLSPTIRSTQYSNLEKIRHFLRDDTLSLVENLERVIKNYYPPISK